MSDATAIAHLPPERIDAALSRLTWLAANDKTPQRVREDLVIVLALAKSTRLPGAGAGSSGGQE